MHIVDILVAVNTWPKQLKQGQNKRHVNCVDRFTGHTTLYFKKANVSFNTCITYLDQPIKK